MIILIKIESSSPVRHGISPTTTTGLNNFRDGEMLPNQDNFSSPVVTGNNNNKTTKHVSGFSLGLGSTTLAE
jgi:hypothetical protein